MRKLPLLVLLLVLLLLLAGSALRLRSRYTPVPGVFLRAYGDLGEARGTGYFYPLYVQPGSPDPTPTAADSPTLRLFDGDGCLLASYRISASSAVVDGGPEQITFEYLSFSASVPWLPDARRVAVYSGTLEIASVSASPHAPRVRLTYPNGGEVLTGPKVTIRWEASDQDGDIKQYLVQYSIDDGTTWEPLRTYRADETTCDLDLFRIRGTDSARVRVFVTDGFSSSWDQSDGPFTIQK